MDQENIGVDLNVVSQYGWAEKVSVFNKWHLATPKSPANICGNFWVLGADMCLDAWLFSSVRNLFVLVIRFHIKSKAVPLRQRH